MSPEAVGAARRGVTRRQCLGAMVAASVPTPEPGRAGESALISITLDLEMSRNFPRWEDTHWDYEKGALDAATRRYAREAGRRVRAAGGVIHYFLVGRALEAEDIGWLQELIREGHPLGNHTYDHVNVLARELPDIQFRFRRAPWLIEGKTPEQVIKENIRLTTAAMRSRLGIAPDGFRTPGGFADGLSQRPDVRAMLIELGYRWVSSRYPAHPMGAPTDRAVIDGALKAQVHAQPYAYPDGLIEVPMSPVSDINAFRVGRWSLRGFLDVIARCVDQAIEKRQVFDFLAHPSCLGVMDPEFRTIDLILHRVKQAGRAAALVDLGRLAGRAPLAQGVRK